ncbi:methyltransferase domain-containing protein [Flagelloscypha sp. PMI_526]|nr:methyltransferase domain-containing protein [Flagelloscypha sp. PMI_526]
MAVYQRHPRYSILLGLLLVATFYVLLPRGPPAHEVEIFRVDGTVSNRIQRANRIYDRFLVQRAGLIQKFGPTPQDVMMFPPDVEPWPAYTVWDFFPAAYNCPHEVERIGALGDGGKWVCGLPLVKNKQDCVVYSFGINHESSFEAEILKSTRHCEIWGYDYTVKSFGPEIDTSLTPRTHFHPYTLGGWDGTGPDDSKMYTLESLMQQNGHKHIDILKIDIEGWEFETLDTVLKPYLDTGRPLPFGQLQIEIHVWNKNFPQFLKWWENLEKVGLRPFWTEPNMVYQNYNRMAHSDLAEVSFFSPGFSFKTLADIDF